jgi:uncharacterized protein YecE (DUF72 family)
LGEVLIGTGGWAYFRGPWRANLEAYSRAFNCVEVNSTFYSIPDMGLVRSWKKRTPEGFHFSVRCHRDLTHRHELRPIDGSFDTYYRMMDICEALDAEILHLLTPAQQELNDRRLRDISEFLASVEPPKARLAWEIRGIRTNAEWQQLEHIMSDHDIVHCVDLSVASPKVRSDILYTRIFGMGVRNLYQFDDHELKDINDKVKGESGRAYLIFHGGRMYEDAARLKVYRETGEFPKASGPIGLESLLRVLREDAFFPSSKDRLIKDQGWKVIDLTSSERAHCSVLLDRLPDRTYLGLDDVRRALERVHLS